jgi:hypothetical protein
MEFRLEENTFHMYLRDVEQELLGQQGALSKADHVDALRRRHEARNAFLSCLEYFLFISRNLYVHKWTRNQFLLFIGFPTFINY